MRRRTLLQNMGLWAVGAPVLFASQGRAQTDLPVRRVVLIFTPNGPQHVTGPTEGTENDFALHPWWNPLEPIKDIGFFFRRVHQAGVRFGDNSEYGHRSGTVGALTGTTTGLDSTQAQGPSLDQFLGAALQQAGVVTPRRSMLWSLQDNASAFYEAAEQPATPTTNPYDVLADIAPAFGQDNELVTKALTRKQLALARAGADCSALRSELDATGREMLDFHCGNIESLEASVEAALEAGNQACAMPDSPVTMLPEDTDWTGRELRDEAMDAYERLLALTFACDITRVVGISFGTGASRFSLPESYGVPASGQVDSGDSGPQMHAWTHQSSSNPDTMIALELFYNWFSSRVASIVQMLRDTPDVDGRPLMDTTLVLWTSEFGSGGPHSNDNVPIMLFGDSEGQLTPGRHFEMDGDASERSIPIHQLMVSIARHMGLQDIDTFGNAGMGPLEWLEG